MILTTGTGVEGQRVKQSNAKVRLRMRPTEPFRREHEELLSHIEHIGRAAREVARLDRAERELLVGRIVEFLRGTLGEFVSPAPGLCWLPCRTLSYFARSNVGVC